MNNWLADFFRECKIVITQIYNLFIALVKIEICRKLWRMSYFLILRK